MKKCMMMDTSTTHTKYDIHGIYTTQETEGTTELDYPIGEQIPYCVNWQTIWEINGRYEPFIILGNQQWTLHNTMVFPSIFPNIKSTKGIDECDWWEWNSGF